MSESADILDDLKGTVYRRARFGASIHDRDTVQFLDRAAAEIERLRAEATALRSEVAALGARIRRHEARARAWEYPEGED